MACIIFFTSILINLDPHNYKFNIYGYFTTLPSIACFIFFIIGTFLVIRYFIKRKIRIVVISLLRKYYEYGENYTCYLMDTNEKKYIVCWKIYDALEGNEVIETLMEGDDHIFQVLSIRKQQKQDDQERCSK